MYNKKSKISPIRTKRVNEKSGFSKASSAKTTVGKKTDKSATKLKFDKDGKPIITGKIGKRKPHRPEKPVTKVISDAVSIQWFPGHMAKTRRVIIENLKLCDLVLEIVDARIPLSSRNPELDEWVAGKPRMILLNKNDNADENMTQRWLDYYNSIGIPSLACDCKSGNGTIKFMPLLRETLAPLLQKRADKGMAGRSTRIMVVGIPNVGKSSFINRMANKRSTKVEDRPGVTRNKQWVSLDSDIDLLDMPGVLWPKFEDPMVGEHLAFTGAIKDDTYDIERLAARLLKYLSLEYKDRLIKRYQIEIDENMTGHQLLCAVGRKRGMLISGGTVDVSRAAITVMDEYRGGKLGRITLEVPPMIAK